MSLDRFESFIQFSEFISFLILTQSGFVIININSSSGKNPNSNHTSKYTLFTIKYESAAFP